MKDYECTCGCHNGLKKHAIACLCKKCEYCGKNIKIKFYKKHLIECASVRDPYEGATFDEITNATKKKKK